MPNLPFINPRRLYRGTGASAAAASRFVALWNASTAAELLVVWSFSLGSAAIWTAGAFNHQGAQGAKVMDGIPVQTGEPAGPGQIFNGTNPAADVLDYSIGAVASSYFASPARGPYAVIQPGWMFGFSTGASAIAITGSFLWQVVRPEELIVAPS